jgi:hypothetical protein
MVHDPLPVSVYQVFIHGIDPDGRQYESSDVQLNRSQFGV